MSSASSFGSSTGSPMFRGGPFSWLRPPPAVTRKHWRVLGILGTANLFDQYNLGIMGLALPQIQAGLGVAEAEIGAVVPPCSSVSSRRSSSPLPPTGSGAAVFSATILGFTFFTFATAFVPDARTFVTLQFLARMCLAAEWMLAIVVIAEEFEPGTRGFGIGMLGAFGILGHGLATIVFSLVNVLPFGWRAIYVLGIAPLLLVAWFRRSLVETDRFVAHRKRRRGERGIRAALQPFRDLARMYPGRMVVLCAALFPAALVLETSMMFPSKFLQDVHSYAPSDVALLYITIGVLVPIGNIVAGSLGDRLGRKRVMVAGLIANAVAVALFYNASGRLVPPFWGLMVYTQSMVGVLFAALGSELFPTSHRSTASGVRSIVWALGFASGLALEGWIYSIVENHGTAITWMLVAAPIAPLVVALWLPETASRELEEIAPERYVA